MGCSEYSLGPVWSHEYRSTGLQQTGGNELAHPSDFVSEKQGEAGRQRLTLAAAVDRS